MRKTVAVILCFLLVYCFPSCASSEQGGSSEAPSSVLSEILSSRVVSENSEIPSQIESEASSDISSEASSEPEEELPTGEIEALRYVAFVTGDRSENKTGEKFDVGGTDLGFPVYLPSTNEMLIFFGDTFSRNDMTGAWRSNAMGCTSDFDLSDGLDLEGFLTENGKQKSGNAVAVIEGKHNKDEVTKIPTGAVEIDGTVYMFYFSKYSWDLQVDSMNYGGCVKSTDGGNTWQRVNELTWANHGTGNCSIYGEKNGVTGNEASDIQALINEDICGVGNKANIDISHHEGYFFTQIFPVENKDGYIYIFGEGGYRTHGIKLGRVKREEFENFDAYEYLVGYENDGDPVFVKGRDGLDILRDSRESFILGDETSKYGEHSVYYNPYLKKWVLTYLEDGKGGICYSLADDIYGPYSKGETLIGYDFSGLPDNVSSIYHNGTHEKWIADGGKKMYLLLSQYTPIYNTSVIEITFK